MILSRNKKLVLRGNKIIKTLKKNSFWRACIPQIKQSDYNNSINVGGNIEIETITNQSGLCKQIENVNNFLYWVTDENIQNVLKGEDYECPVKNPDGDGYVYIKPTYVDDNSQCYVMNNDSYSIENKVYYIVPAPPADTFMSFTAPFNVEKLYIMETCDESILEKVTLTDDDIAQNITLWEKTLKVQAKYNADFVSFFNMSLQLYPKKSFEEIFSEYVDWAKTQKNLNVGKFEIIPYYGTNWQTANYYASHFLSASIDENGELKTELEYLSEDDEFLYSKGESYSIRLLYDGIPGGDDWDYWSGKFLIFESSNGPHVIEGGKSVGTITTKITDDLGGADYGINYDQINFGDGSQSDVTVSGNNTFAQIRTNRTNLYTLDSSQSGGGGLVKNDSGEMLHIEPTNMFLYSKI